MFSYLTSCGYQYKAKLLEAKKSWENGRNVVHEELFFHAEVYAAAGIHFYEFFPTSC